MTSFRLALLSATAFAASLTLSGCGHSAPASTPPADAGLTCDPGPVCGSICCTADQECVLDACVARCESGARCGAQLTCCGADEECRDGACAKKCVPDCRKPGGVGVKDCGDDGCNGQCPPGCGPAEECTAEFTCAVPVHTGNDTCDTARRLQFYGDVAVERGDTTGGASDTTFACARRVAGLDVAYTMVLEHRKKVSVVVEPEDGSTIVPVIDIRLDCATASTALTCIPAPVSGASATAELAVLSAGTYTVWVSSTVADAAGAGAFRLTVTLSPPDQPVPTNDTCLGATELTFTDGKVQVDDTTLYALDDTSGGDPCTQALTGPDLVYKIVVAAPSALTATLALSSTNTGGLYLRQGCDATAANLVCASGRRGTQIASSNLTPGDYFLFIDGLSTIGEPFTLSVAMGPIPANDSCTSGPETINVDAATGAGTASGDTSFASADSGGSGYCGASARDLVYKVHFDQERLATFTVTPATGSALRPLVYVRAACDDPSKGSLVCGYMGSTASAAVGRVRLAAGDYHVWVGGLQSTAGAFTLDVTSVLVVPPANDACANAIEVTLDSTTGTGSVTGTTIFGIDDYQGTTCGGTSPMNGPDLVYKVTLTDPASLSAAVTRDGTSSTLVPAVYIRTACASTATADEKACVKGSSSNPAATALIPSADATTYYIIVDGTNGSSGDFKLEVTAGPLVSNDGCASPELIAIDTTTGVGTATGDTSRGKNDDYGTCQTANATSADLVYQFTLAQDQAVAIAVTPASGSTLKPALFLRTACNQRSSQLLGGCVASATSAPTSLSFPVLSAGTYYLWIDGTYATSASSGAFTVTVTATAAPPAPAGDTCTAPATLALAATSDPAVFTGTATGELTNARDDARGVGFCAGSLAGDLVYKVTLGSTQKLAAKLTPDPTTTSYQPVVFIRAACGGTADSDQLACAAAASAGGTATATANSLAAGDYYVWVDGLTNGKFTLEVTATTPVAGPANDSCTAPETLTFTGNTATATGTTVDAQNDTRSASNGYGSVGGDVVYTFTLTTTDPRRINVTATAATGAPSGFRPVVIIRNGCAAINDLVPGARAPTGSQTATATVVPTTTAGTYFVWVDTDGNTPVPGPFTLTVGLEIPNDQCANYISLTAGTAVTGDTTAAADQYGTTGGFSTVCATALGTTTDTDGPDLVYAYRPAAAGNFTITLTPSASFDGILWVTTGTNSCGVPASCVALADAARSGGVETLTISGTALTRYYILVDSYQPTMTGSFSLLVQ